MFSFEGRYKTNRVQSFDRNEKVTANDLVRQTKEERRKRELLRIQNQAAIKVQAWVRGLLSRLSTRRLIEADFDQLMNKAQTFAAEHVTDLAKTSQLISRLLRLLNWYCRKSPDKDRLFSVCRLMLSKPGRVIRDQWISTTSPEYCFLLGRTLRVVLCYLSTLLEPVPSSEFALPLRLLEDVLTVDHLSTHSQSTIVNRAALCRYLGRHHYFRILAQLVDKQVPSSAGYLSAMTDTPDTTPSSFDPDEFINVPQARELLTLLWIPLVWAQRCVSCTDHSVEHLQSLHTDLLTMALNDILVPQSTDYNPSERVIRGVGNQLFDLPCASELIAQLCSPSSMSLGDSGSSPIGVVPSLNLLYLLATVVIPKLTAVRYSKLTIPSPAHPSEETTSDPIDDLAVADPSLPTVDSNTSLSAPVAADLVRFAAWLLLQTLHSPGLACIRPLRQPKPLVSPNVGDSPDSSDDEQSSFEVDDRTASAATVREETIPLVYSPAWPTQLCELLTALRQTLPTLASSALTSLPMGPRAIRELSTEQIDLVYSLAHLHYALIQVYGLPSTAMVALNSIYSQHPVLIRTLWHLIQQSEVNQRLRSTFGGTTSGYNLFQLLTYGELPEKMTELQHYLPLLFTFADCLRHRLVCLTDAEISGTEAGSDNSLSSLGCGFQSTELLQVGLRLRDLMLGLIELSHPDQVPKYMSTSGGEGASRTEVYREVFERLEQRAALAASRAALVSPLRRSGWSLTDSRIQLQCWTDLFRRVQRLVFQIYDWDRRCHRQSLSDFGVSDEAQSTDSTATGPVTRSIWVKENIATSVDASLRMWLRHGDEKGGQILAGVPFGYYSLLNPDRNPSDQPVFLTNREVRQVLILKEVPFVIPFERRVRLFQLLVDSSRLVIQGSNVPTLAEIASYSDFHTQPQLSILVRRTHLYEDAYEKLSKDNEPDLKPRLRVRFMNQVGTEEAGVDGGGLSREFLSEVIRDGFHPNRGFFIFTAEKTLYPNPEAALLTEDYLKHYYFLGRVLAKALYEGMLVELHFAHFFLAKLVSRSGGGVGFDYLHSLDPELYRQLSHLKTYTNDVRNLMLDFTVVHSAFGESKAVELKPNGAQIPVTNENRVEYVHLMAHYKLNRQIYPQSRAFIAGLNDVINIEWLRLFDANELQTLISGADTPIDIDDLKRHTIFQTTSPDHQETIENFWSVLRSLSEQDKRLFLRFVTACSRPPMFGFRDLVPPFCIQITPDLERLPTASTCVNTFRLPNFRDPNVIRERLLYALHSNAGFEYS